MKKSKNGRHFLNINCMENFQIMDSAIVVVSGFPSVDGNGISMLIIVKELKNDHHFLISMVQKNFKLLIPLKFGSLVF